MISTPENIISVMERVYGVDVARYSEQFLVSAINKRMGLAGVQQEEEYLNLLNSNHAEGSGLINSLNISYSEFFRNPVTFSLLEQIVLPKIIERKKKGGELRIWSAGCAAGQEPYSAAILLDYLVDREKIAIPLRIFATDINAEEISSAKEGSYNFASIQNIPVKFVDRYFEKRNNLFHISELIKNKADFSVYDLMDSRSVFPPSSIYGDFDLVFCCNLLFYYKDTVRKNILNNLARSLSAGGFFITGEAESAIVEQNIKFGRFSVQAGIYQKL